MSSLSSILSVVLPIGFVLCMLSEGLANTFTLVPHRVAHHGDVWTFITHAVAETDPLLCAGSVLVLLHVGSVVEGAWGIRPLMFYLAALHCFVGVALTGLAIVLPAAIGKESSWGGSAVGSMALSVLYARLQPDGSVLSWMPALRSRHIPVAFVATALFRDLLYSGHPVHDVDDVEAQHSEGKAPLAAPLVRGPVAALLLVTFLTSWAYLRYFHGGGSRDPQFALSEMVPRVAGRAMAKLERIIERRVFGDDAVAEVDHHPRSILVDNPQPLPGTTEEDAERRRALALKALAKRFGTAPQ